MRGLMYCAIPNPPSSTAALVLLVDDQPEELHWLIRLLKPNYRLAFASDGLSALHKAEAQRPDLVLLDIGLPDLDGFTLCRRLKACPATAEVPLLFLSSHNDAQRRIEGLQLGAVDFISKDCHAEEVLARVRLHLSLSQRLRGSSSSSGGEPPPGSAPANPDEALVLGAVTHIRNHLDQALTVGAIARHFGLTEKRLLCLFREQLGQTVSGFISEERIRCGQRLLQETSLSIQQIALTVGYGNPGNFATAFRERHGMSPLAYRLALREDRACSPADAAA